MLAGTYLKGRPTGIKQKSIVIANGEVGLDIRVPL